MPKSTIQSKHEIAQAAADAIKVINEAKADALKVANEQDKNLIVQITRIETKLEQVIKDVADIKNNIVARIDRIEIDYVTKVEHEKVIDDIVLLKNWKNWLIGSSSVIIALGTFLAVALFNHLTQVLK